MFYCNTNHAYEESTHQVAALLAYPWLEDFPLRSPCLPSKAQETQKLNISLSWNLLENDGCSEWNGARG